MQRLFAVELVANGGNITRAAIRAGYSPKSARQIGQHLLDKPYVQQEIRREQQRCLGGRLASKALSVLEGILDDSEAPPGARVDAAKTILDRAGLPAIPANKLTPVLGESDLRELTSEELRAYIAQGEAWLRTHAEEPECGEEHEKLASGTGALKILEK